MFTIGGLCMATTIVFELWRCPPPDGVSQVKTALEIALLWPLLPLIGFYLGTMPALEAQTRLMFGIPLGYVRHAEVRRDARSVDVSKV